ncbi:WD40 repeat-like protein [Wolfiporia cocos MD-104 SS10]|uniref:WD40 repeat-like protein n=1 Tax=Wolfiporia cocos (strain MD-104) TaxID=742152 RepID=A0A2H3JA74_WOLCO|nr:WD40 repeat-like protein [Wolfiporia cocos MD-104 SS10]
MLRDLPTEIALHILSFVDDPKTLARAGRVSRSWNRLLDDEWIWQRMCNAHGYVPSIHDRHRRRAEESHHDNAEERTSVSASAPSVSTLDLQPISSFSGADFSFRTYFKRAFTTTANWMHGGKLLRVHRIPLSSNAHQAAARRDPLDPAGASSSSAIPTSVALDESWIIVGLANSRIHVFSARTGVLSRTLVGHESGVWAVALVKGSIDPAASPENDADESSDPGGEDDSTMPLTLRRALGLGQEQGWSGRRARRRSASDVFRRRQESASRGTSKQSPKQKPSDPAGTSDGWGQPNALVVSGGCDKELRIWDVKSGWCIYTLRGHTSTIRCLKVVHGRPIAITGSRDRTLRVWDIQRGRPLRVLEGHEESVRCLDVYGSHAVSGSYDHTCRLWDVDTGECLHVLRGHFDQVYCVAYDGVRIVSGGLDTTVRIWDPHTGTCVALLQGHTALVCQLQLLPTMLATGGSDGRVIVFSLSPSYQIMQRLAAHDSSVTGLQLDERFLVTGGNDGRVRLFRFDHAAARCDYVRELTEQSENVWKVAFTREACAVMCKRAGKTVMEIWSFKGE